MPRSTLFPGFPLVNSANQNNFHVVPSSRRASDAAGFVAPTFPERCVEGHNNILSGGENEKTKEETCAIANSYREKENGQQLGTSGRVEDKSTTCGRATGQRGRIHSLVVQFFLNWHREATPLDPVRTFSHRHLNQSSPRTTAPHVPVSVRLPLARIPALSPTLDEMHAKLICNLAGVKFGAIWDISEKAFVLFQDPITTTSLVLPVNNFCVQAVRSHLRESREKFGIGEDL